MPPALGAPGAAGQAHGFTPGAAGQARGAVCQARGFQLGE
jgi:hypothetical protein